MQDFDADEHDDEDFISKTQIKNEADELQQLGLKLMALKPSLWSKFPLNDHLAVALEESKRISSHEAKRRHGQFVGRLMRNADIEAIRHQLALLDSSSQEFQQIASLAERWRHQLLNDKTAFTDYVEQYQPIDKQALRQLIRNTSKELSSNDKETQQAQKQERKPILKNKFYKQLYKQIKLHIESQP